MCNWLSLGIRCLKCPLHYKHFYRLFTTGWGNIQQWSELCLRRPSSTAAAQLSAILLEKPMSFPHQSHILSGSEAKLQLWGSHHSILVQLMCILMLQDIASQHERDLHKDRHAALSLFACCYRIQHWDAHTDVPVQTQTCCNQELVLILRLAHRATEVWLYFQIKIAFIIPLSQLFDFKHLFYCVLKPT